MFIGLGAIVRLTSLQSMINDNSVSVVFGHAKRQYNFSDTIYLPTPADFKTLPVDLRNFLALVVIALPFVVIVVEKECCSQILAIVNR